MTADPKSAAGEKARVGTFRSAAPPRPGCDGADFSASVTFDMIQLNEWTGPNGERRSRTVRISFVSGERTPLG